MIIAHFFLQNIINGKMEDNVKTTIMMSKTHILYLFLIFLKSNGFDGIFVTIICIEENINIINKSSTQFYRK